MSHSKEDCVLGCPDSRVLLMDFCGKNIVYDLTNVVSFFKWGRELDDESQCEVTIHFKGDADGRACCEALANTRTWRNEILITRGGHPVWGPGPLVTISVQREIGHLTARDATAWLDRRMVHLDYEFVGTDIAHVAKTCIQDALLNGPAVNLPPDQKDLCILGLADFRETGKRIDYEIQANRKTAREVLADLTDDGLDFTMLGRSLIVGTEFAFGPYGPLRDMDFSGDLLVTEHGLAAANRWYVSSDKAQGSAGGPDPFFGLLEQGVEGSPASTSPYDLGRAASDRLLTSNPPPLVVTVPSGNQLTPKAPVCPEILIPGTLFDLSIRDLCRPADVRERLTSVNVTKDDKGEHVGITLAPLGDQVVSPDQEEPV